MKIISLESDTIFMNKCIDDTEVSWKKPGSVRYPMGSISKSGHENPSKLVAPMKPAAAKSLTIQKKSLLKNISYSFGKAPIFQMSRSLPVVP